MLYPQGPGICAHYAVQATALKRRATPIGATVVSHNVSEFSRVEGMQLVDWAATPLSRIWSIRVVSFHLRVAACQLLRVLGSQARVQVL